MPLVLDDSRPRPAFCAVVVADSAAAHHRVAGLTLAERARRVAARLGATWVYVVGDGEARAALPAWWSARRGGALLLISADDQVVHTPLAQPLLSAAGRADRLVAVTPSGTYAGALWAAAEAADELVAAIADPARCERELAAAWRERDDVVCVRHGELARAAATTPAERRRAATMLYRTVHKPQDGPVTRWLYRPVSLRITRLLLDTEVTPNQVSAVVAALGVVGIYLTAHASYGAVALGSTIILVAGYIDGCDGEIARLKLMTSRLGAWMDTITDELTTAGYMLALGWHNYLRHPSAWVAGTILVGLATYAVTIAGIYYELIVVLGSANSQDYIGRYEPVPARGALRPVVASRRDRRDRSLGRAAAEVAPHLLRRDFVNWGALVFALLDRTGWSYAFMIVGGVASAAVIGRDHLRLRRQIEALRRGSR